MLYFHTKITPSLDIFMLPCSYTVFPGGIYSFLGVARCSSAERVLSSFQGIVAICWGAVLSHWRCLIEFQSVFPTTCWRSSRGTSSNAPSPMLSNNSSFCLLGLSMFSHLRIIYHTTTFYINEALVVSDVITFSRERRKKVQGYTQYKIKISWCAK